MKILIVAATHQEVEPLLARFRFQWTINKRLHRYLHESTNIDVLITGVGMVSTAFLLGKTLAENQYNYALNLGIAGSFDDQIELGEVVFVASDCFSEMGAEDGSGFIPLTDLGLPESQSTFNPIQRPFGKLRGDVLEELKQVKAITVNTVHGNEQSIDKVKELCNPDIESMEGASFYFACADGGVDSLQVRSISNWVEPRDKNRWNIPLAIENLNTFAFRLITAL